MDIHLLPKKRNKTREYKDAYILANKGLDAALIALELHVSEGFVLQRQRKLRIRPLTGNPRRLGYGKLALRPVRGV